ncbi:hypothetical protein V5E97_26455 [Singulisphaera sp. Ch08]|uniref:Transposase n=1 Tax=Singulisphaera sp. Ch08 TaxID=3120278 RepID=A0AAU7CA35_9BACT
MEALAAHAQRYRRHDKTTGPIWQGPDKAIPVQDDAHLATVLRYVERNPLRAELVARAEHGRRTRSGPVKRRRRWNWNRAFGPPPSFCPNHINLLAHLNIQQNRIHFFQFH